MNKFTHRVSNSGLGSGTCIDLNVSDCTDIKIQVYQKKMYPHKYVDCEHEGQIGKHACIFYVCLKIGHIYFMHCQPRESGDQDN